MGFYKEFNLIKYGNKEFLLHQVGVFLGGLIAGTGLGSGAGHLVVTADDGLGELLMELEKETD